MLHLSPLTSKASLHICNEAFEFNVLKCTMFIFCIGDHSTNVFVRLLFVTKIGIRIYLSLVTGNVNEQIIGTCNTVVSAYYSRNI
jgi:hypothetical protein